MNFFFKHVVNIFRKQKFPVKISFRYMVKGFFSFRNDNYFKLLQSLKIPFSPKCQYFQ